MTTTHQWGFQGANVQSDTMVYGYQNDGIRISKKMVVYPEKKKIIINDDLRPGQIASFVLNSSRFLGAG